MMSGRSFGEECTGFGIRVQNKRDNSPNAILSTVAAEAVFAVWRECSCWNTLI